MVSKVKTAPWPNPWTKLRRLAPTPPPPPCLSPTPQTAPVASRHVSWRIGLGTTTLQVSTKEGWHAVASFPCRTVTRALGFFFPFSPPFYFFSPVVFWFTANECRIFRGFGCWVLCDSVRWKWEGRYGWGSRITGAWRISVGVVWLSSYQLWVERVLRVRFELIGEFKTPSLCL